MYVPREQLRDIRVAKGQIEAATSVDELRAPLLAICRIIEHELAEDVADTDLILGRPRGS